MTGKRLLILHLLVFIFHLSFCRAEHMFEAGIHGGVAGWSSRPVYVETQAGFNGGAQICYDYLSPHLIGLRTGLMLDCHHAGFGKTDYEDHYSTIDVESQRMDVDYSIGILREVCSAWSVGVPLQVALSKRNILFLLGAKAVFPLSASWYQTVERASLSVYYPEYDNRVYESLPLSASRDFAMHQEGRLRLPRTQWWLSIELSYRVPLEVWSRRYRSYIVVGVYFDYCLTRYTPVRSAAESLVMLTDTREGFPLQRLLTPVMEANRQGDQLVRECTMLSAGIKISYALSPYSFSRRSYPCHCLGVW